MRTALHRLGAVVVLVSLGLFVAACGSETTVDGIVLEGTMWRATAIAGVDPVAGREPTIRFAAPGASGSGGCNDYSSTRAEIDGNAITITNLTMQSKFCEPRESELMKVEQRFFVALAAATEIHVVDGHLELVTPDGPLMFSPVPAPGASVR